MGLTHSPDPPHLLDGAGTAASQTARPRMYADHVNGGWTATDPDTVLPTLTTLNPATAVVSPVAAPMFVTLTGTGFTGASKVTSDGSPLPVGNFTVVSATRIDATVSKRTTPGVTSIAVVNATHTSNALPLTFS